MHDNVIAFPSAAAARAATTGATRTGATRQASDASIVRFSSPDVARQSQATMQRISEAEHLASLAGGISSDVALNELLRERRKDAWRRADAKVCFLCSQLDLFAATKHAQRHGLVAARGLPVPDEGERFNLVENCRRALLEQILTPAPTVADLAWKRRKVASLNPYDWVGATLEQVEEVLDRDETFLRSFPTRRSPNRPK